MSKGRLPMRKIKEILRLKHENGLSVRKIGICCNLNSSTVSDYLARAKIAGISWPIPDDMDDEILENLLFPKNVLTRRAVQEPDFPVIHQELRKKGVTLQLLWIEYKEQNPLGYQYSRFCELYQQWKKIIDPVLRQSYKAGEKLFVDYAGPTMTVVDTATGEKMPAYVFVAVLGASNYTYIEASLSLDLYAWISANCRALEYLGGVPEIIVPDNLKTGVKHPCRYEPDINPTYQEMANHYGVVVMPTRVAKPQDKAKVEKGVQFVEGQVMAPLRNRIFFNINELNLVLKEYLEKLNSLPFQKIEGTRKSLFESLEKPALSPLPDVRYQFAHWKKVKVNIDYHVELEKSYYSAPYQLINQQVDARITDNTVEILSKGNRVALHPRQRTMGAFSTDPNHMPTSHKEYLEWTPDRLINWAKEVGPYTSQAVEKILSTYVHPQQGFRSCLGLIRLASKYSKDRLEIACLKLLAVGTPSYRGAKSILSKGLDKQVLNETTPATPIKHDNLRGPGYYGKPKGGTYLC